MLGQLSSQGPSPALRRLLETKLDTFEKLELVSVLAKRAGMTGTTDDLARELQIGTDVLGRVAADLARSGLVEVAGERIPEPAHAFLLILVGIFDKNRRSPQD